MKRYCNNRQGEKGSSLIEALIGTLLLSILFVGMNSVLSRTLASQRYVNTQGIAVLEMREGLFVNGVAGVCGNDLTSISIASHQLAMASPACSSPILADVGVPGQLEDLPANSVPAVTMAWNTDSTENSQDLIGGNGVVRVAF